ncbi:ABC transporter transmembrane domain-containing protein [uncultured Methylobacterium sp.]|uniref:ABC transporter transmembrane domain-containing protein n=1 Tax=uncultured Methylobacterium sp. TaxID=157278 RepID=UPI002598E30D|nr:ABC transporter transmembrane domain-containing protein [uncultured Methylobacterium sp.]
MARDAGDRPAGGRDGDRAARRGASPARAGNDPEAGDASGGLDRSLFRYIWRHSKRDQILICAVVLASLPLYFASLDLPRRIVNEAIQGHAFEKGNETAKFLILRLQMPDWFGGERMLFSGFDVDRFELLFGLSSMFLLLVLINGAFKYWINVAKGALGERMLRRLRFQLFSLIMRFSPDALRHTKASEVATIIRDEVEPIGGFIGDAYILPAFLGTQAATAMTFILLQNVWLGLLAAGVVGVQFVVIPRLRRELLRLGRQRQLASRRLAGRVGEVVDGIAAVHSNGAEAWERAEIGHRLGGLFDLRLRIYRRKFMVKFLNNLLAQMTPFLFYCIGGYFALKGQLSIGQLVAVIAAYRDLPPPLKELIDWDQQRLDVQVKYEQVLQQFLPERLLGLDAPGRDEPLCGRLAAEGVGVQEPHGPVLANVSLALPLPAIVGIVSDGGPAASTFARVLARRAVPTSGRVTLEGHDLSEWAGAALTRRIAFAGVDPILFPGSLRENIVYGLNRRPPDSAVTDAKALAEAHRTGNPVAPFPADWIDYAQAGVADAGELDALILDWLTRIGMGEEVYRFGLLGQVDPERHPDLAARLIEARIAFRERLAAEGHAHLVEPFDPARYNRQATVAENLLFGVPTTTALTGRALAEHPVVRLVLDRTGLADDLVTMGERIAATMLEIFRGLPSGHPLFEQFSFLSADELPEYEAILARRTATEASAERHGTSTFERLRRRWIGLGRYGSADATRLIALPLAYIEPRHRLGLIDDAFRERLVEARGELRTTLDEAGLGGVDFYDPDRVCAAAPLRDNLLFGRVNQSVADAVETVTKTGTALVQEMQLAPAITRVGLDHQVGPEGRFLSGSQRAVVSLVRALVRRPDLLVLDGALSPMGETRARTVLELLLERFGRENSLVAVLPNDRVADRFALVLRAVGTQIHGPEAPPARQDDVPRRDAAARQGAAARQDAAVREDAAAREEAPAEGGALADGPEPGTTDPDPEEARRAERDAFAAADAPGAGGGASGTGSSASGTGSSASGGVVPAGAGVAAPAAAVSRRADNETGPEPARVEQDVKA